MRKTMTLPSLWSQMSKDKRKREKLKTLKPNWSCSKEWGSKAYWCCPINLGNDCLNYSKQKKKSISMLVYSTTLFLWKISLIKQKSIFWELVKFWNVAVGGRCVPRGKNLLTFTSLCLGIMSSFGRITRIKRMISKLLILKNKFLSVLTIIEWQRSAIS